jgi:hypothetical protein
MASAATADPPPCNSHYPAAGFRFLQGKPKSGYRDMKIEAFLTKFLRVIFRI